MRIRVLIVDDSGFFRHRIEELLRDERRIEVVGTACNGREAVDKAVMLKPDVITMDVEMPQLNGIEAVRIIMRDCPTSVLMLSSLTREGARTTLEALEAGAADYLSKDIRRWMDKSQLIRSQLIERILALGFARRTRRRLGQGRCEGTAAPSVPPPRGTARTSGLPLESGGAQQHQRRTSDIRQREPASPPAAAPRVPVRPDEQDVATSNPARVPFPDCSVVVIGSSTGGPAALQQILTRLPADFPYPLLLVQHMPKTFTQVFAERLNQQCQIAIKEAQDNDRLRPGLALLAPGGLQMMIDPRQMDRVRIVAGDTRLTYRPSVDVTYASAARAYGQRVLALILTGMGADGCDGARLLKREGATIWAQNRDSATIYGMPRAVVNAGLADAVLDLADIGPLLAKGRRK